MSDRRDYAGNKIAILKRKRRRGLTLGRIMESFLAEVVFELMPG